jgi:phage-related protein
MSTIANLVIAVRADTGAAEKDLKGLGSKVGSGLGKALMPATVALGAMGVVGKLAFDNLQDGARNAAQTDAVIKSTGDASNVTAKHVDDLAMSLRAKAGVDDDVVHSGENMLLTFTNVRNEVGKGNDIFDQATKTMLDMSHALGQDTKSSALQLGKALNDPVKGMTALQRVGVSFTEAQKKQVKGMVDAGNTMGAQRLILHELNKEFGGSAEKIDPTTKALANMKLDAVDLASNLVQGLLPALKVFASLVSKATAFMEEHQTATKIVVGTLAALATGIVVANVAMKVFASDGALVTVATKLWTAAQWLLNAALDANPIALVILALVALGAAIVLAWTKSETFRRIVTEAWNAIKSTTTAVFNAVKNVVLGAWHAIETATEAVLTFLKEHWRAAVVALATILLGPLGTLVAVIATHWSQIKGAASSAWNAVESTVTGAVNRVRSVVSSVFTALGNIVKGAAGAVRAGASSIESALNPIITVLRDIAGAAEHAMGMLDSIANKASSVGGIVGKAKGLLGHIPGFASGVSNFAGGMALVGENGPELVNLPGGSSVFTNSDSRRMLAGAGGGGPLIGHVTVQSDVDVEVLARRVSRLLAFQNGR